MVNNDLIVFVILATPALASPSVAAAAWWTAPGRAPLGQVAAWRSAAARTAAARVARWRWAPAALVVLISAALGLLAYLSRAPDVSGSRALDGAAIALAASAIPLSMYYTLGRLIRRAMAVLVVWLLSLLPLYYYAIFAVIVVASWAQCTPGQYECPV
jgi:hypothetical protein